MTLSSKRWLDLLIALGHNLLTTSELDTLLDQVLQQVLDFTDHDSGSIMLYDKALDTLVVQSSTGVDIVLRGVQVPNLKRSIAGHVFSSGQPLVLQGHAENAGVEWRDYTRDLPSVVCLPILAAEQRPIGVLVLKNTVAARDISPTDLDGLLVLAAQLGAVIENGRLHADRTQLLASLADRERQLQQLLGELLNAQEEERRRIAYDLHDGLAQTAASTHQHLQALAAHYRPRSATARQELSQALELSRRTVREARYLMAGLRPTALDDLGLAVALRLEIEQLWSNGWDVTFEELTTIGRLPNLIETALFRVTQEALSNIRKHAGATRIAVRLDRNESQVLISVQDWGAGFDPEASPTERRCGEKMGLIGMHERMNLLGGICHVRSTPGQGTTVIATAPLTS